MFVQSTFTSTQTRPNKRSKPKKKKSVRNFKSIQNFTGTITGGQSPHYGIRKDAGAQGKLKLPALTITPWKVILTSFLIGICGILYISHVFSTQQILQEVQQLESEYNRVKRTHSEVRLEFDRMVGPKEIYQQAREQGFINAGPADQLLILKK